MAMEIQEAPLWVNLTLSAVVRGKSCGEVMKVGEIDFGAVLEPSRHGISLKICRMILLDHTHVMPTLQNSISRSNERSTSIETLQKLIPNHIFKIRSKCCT